MEDVRRMRKILLSIACLLAITVKADNISVGTQAELAALAGSTHEGDVITLTADIALTFGSGEYWTPIGTFTTPFEGTFEGNGHTISGISIDYTTGDELAGLFGYVGTSGVVKNVIVAGGVDDYIYSNGDSTNTNFVGAVVGYNAGTVQYCGNTAPISAIHKNGRAGGVVGYNTGTITGCYNLGTVQRSGVDVSTIYVGGIVGNNQTGGTVSGCMSTSGITPDMTLANKDDNASTVISYKNQTVNVLLDSRTLYADDCWNTLCLPFTIPASALAGAEVRTLSSSAYADGVLTLNFSDPVSTLSAGVPYIIKWPKADGYVDDDAHNIVSPSFTGVTIVEGYNDVETSYVDFHGTYNYLSASEENRSILLVGAGNTLYWPLSDASVGAQHAYFRLKGLEAGDINAAHMNFVEDDVTGIIDNKRETITNNCGSITDDCLYDLQGRRLSPLTLKKGIYIHNGKKVVLK
jgi:hypothetical protein